MGRSRLNHEAIRLNFADDDCLCKCSNYGQLIAEVRSKHAGAAVAVAVLNDKTAQSFYAGAPLTR
jgi:hypothetical protein